LGCLSRIRILIFTHPGSRIQKTAKKERGERKFVKFFCSHKLHKTENYFIFEMLTQKLTQKMSLSSKKYGFGIRDPEKPYSESRGQKGARSRNRNTEVS
jgi:hypothetical protein